MPQMARTDDTKPAEQIKAAGNMVADVAETAASVVKRTAAKSVAAAEQMTRHVPWLAAAMPGSGNDLAGFWRELVNAQMAHNLDASRQLATARDWQERFAVQSSYISGNLARMSEAATRCLQLSATMVSPQLTTAIRDATKTD